MGAIAVLFLFSGSAAPAEAQVVTPFRIEHLHGAVELGFFTNLEDRSRKRSSESNFDRVELSQLLNLKTDGYIYHPEFLTFDTGLKVELIEGVAGDSDNRILGGGDWRFNFLENRKNSLSIYGTYLQSEIQQPFSNTYEITNQLYGATFFQKWGWIPFDLSYQHGSREGGLGDQLNDSWDKVLFDGRYQIGERSDGKLEYDLAYEDIQEQSLRRQNASASNFSYFGEGDDKRLNTNLRFFEEVNGRTLRNFNGSTDFDWKHSDDLRTSYDFSGRWNDSGSQTVTSLDSRFFLIHQLYDSLESRFEIYGHYEDATFRTRYELGTNIAHNYLKDLGSWGRLNVLVAPHVSFASNRLEEDTAFVFDETHVMVGLVPSVLRQQDIIEFSIVVTSESGAIVYDEGPLGDYIVNQVSGGLETEIVRTPISTIADGQLVLVDYEFELIGDNDTLSTGVDVYSTLYFSDHWSVFGRYNNTDYHVLSGDDDSLRLNRFDRYKAGVRYQGLWLTAKAEYDESDATFGSFRGYTGAASLITHGANWWSARLNAEYAYRDNFDTGENVNRFSVSGSASRRLFKRGVIEAEGSWLRARWSGESSEANDIDAFHVTLHYSWWYGKVEVRLETGFAQLLRPTEDRSVFKFDLWVRRVF